MSSLNVHDINGISTYGNEVRIPSGSSLNVQGDLDVGSIDVGTRLELPVWTDATRPSNPALGTIGYNDDNNNVKRLEFYDGNDWVEVTKQEVLSVPVTSGLTVWFDGDSEFRQTIDGKISLVIIITQVTLLEQLTLELGVVVLEQIEIFHTSMATLMLV